MPAGFGDIKIAGGDTGQPLAMAKRLNVVRRHLRAGAQRFLDCGCGAGSYVLALVDSLALDAHGLEYSEDKVRQAWLNPRLRDRISQGDLQSLSLRSDEWDYAMLNEVLEHVPDELKALREVRRVLRASGTLFIFSPNRWFPFETHGVHLRKSKRPVYWVPFVPYIPLWLGARFFDYWARNYWPGELQRIVTNAGFSIVERTFIWQTFEGISQHQPRLITSLRPLFRATSNTLERTPVLRRFGVSQVLVCRNRG